jgi:uracil-DNA glycosylase
MITNLNEFITALQEVEPPANTWNHYSQRDSFGHIRQRNLWLHWQRMLSQPPTVLLLGEAVGYRGGRLTGLPFVSEQILLSHSFFGTGRGFQKTAEWPTICREATATIVWQTLDACGTYPVLWNVFPFHPHRSGQPASNRQPTVKELSLGEEFVQRLLELFPITTIVAVGNTAEAALNRWRLPHAKVRHPSHGGKQRFQAGLTAVLDEST